MSSRLICPADLGSWKSRESARLWRMLPLHFCAEAQRLAWAKLPVASSAAEMELLLLGVRAPSAPNPQQLALLRSTRPVLLPLCSPSAAL